MENSEPTKHEKKLLNEAISFVRIHKSKNPSNFKQIEYYEGNKFVCQETLFDNKVVSLLFPSFSETPYQICSELLKKYVTTCIERHKTEEVIENGRTIFRMPVRAYYANQILSIFPEIGFYHCGGQLRDPKTDKNLTWEQTKKLIENLKNFIDNNQKNQHTISNT